MTSPETARCIIAAEAIRAKIESMIVANREREAGGQAMVYNEDAFLACSHELEMLSIAVANQ